MITEAQTRPLGQTAIGNTGRDLWAINTSQDCSPYNHRKDYEAFYSHAVLARARHVRWVKGKGVPKAGEWSQLTTVRWRGGSVPPPVIILTSPSGSDSRVLWKSGFSN